jgi:hypothetical protein
MSFYVTLPSNSSFEYFPENTLNNYTTKLHTTLRLDCIQFLGNYEVGLVEMSYPHNWIYKKDGFITYYMRRTYIIHFSLLRKLISFYIKLRNKNLFYTRFCTIEITSVLNFSGVN